MTVDGTRGHEISPGVWDDGAGTMHVDIDACLLGNGYEANEQTRAALAQCWQDLARQGIAVEIVE